MRDETINVAWGDPVTLRVRETRHGPVIDDFIRRSDDLTPQGHVLALQATALDGNDTSAEGFGRFGLAQNWEDFLNAARKIVSPMQNMVYADTAGNIGLVSPAHVPNPVPRSAKARKLWSPVTKKGSPTFVPGTNFPAISKRRARRRGSILWTTRYL